ncbi:TetR/AcrR family transcriptional regulator [Nocardia vermiculata]|uniref:TetR/AcrR family transcriptional regulator n=1 Tax=Nocardia vermiculata TaxID=257274 RepID=A0A846Y931_9NOCA|nr:TetR/AcrR family transcriptional regulator [Nocardia vermiculata]NKY54342.1 TetR/AcrR family transcriptional regulator [Nocardia vermiculata]
MASTRRQDILFHAAKLFSERGVAGTTVRDIADDVGILSGSLYHHFASKDAIVFEIVTTFVEDLNERYEAALMPGETARERLDRMVAVSFEAAMDHPFATEIYQNESSVSSQPDSSRIAVAVRRANSYWDEAITRGVRTGEFRDDVDPNHFHRMLRESVWLTVRFNRPSLEQNADKLRHDLITVFLGGFTASPATPVPATTSVAQSAVPAEHPAPASAATDDSALSDLQRDVRELEQAVRELRLLRG